MRRKLTRWKLPPAEQFVIANYNWRRSNGKNQESPIIWLTRWQMEVSLPKKSSKDSPKSKDWTMYGVDAEGNERVYAQVPSEQFEK